MSVAGDKGAVGAIHHLVDDLENGKDNATHRKLWAEADAQLQDVPFDSKKWNYLTKSCEENGTLPRLFLDVATSKVDNPIDKNGDGMVTKQELKDATYSKDPVVKMAAEYGLKHFDEMDKNHNKYLDVNEMANFKMSDMEKNSKEDPSKTAPYGTQESKEDLVKTVNDPHATSQERLKAVEELKLNHQTDKVSVKDECGNSHDYSIQVTVLKNGSKIVNLYDEHGKIVLRGVDRKGNMEKQGKSNYTGDQYSTKHVDVLMANENY